MQRELNLISGKYLQIYLDNIHFNWSEIEEKLKRKTDFSMKDFDYYIISSSLYSSKIEGNTLDVNSFFRNWDKKTSVKKKEVTEIESLMNAYKFASENPLNAIHFLTTHKILSETILPSKERGVLRKGQVGIRDSKTLRPVYLAVEPEYLKAEFDKLFEDIRTLLNENLSIEETFYYASMIHLWTALIHPFNDGNGRAARLLEKWFLASKIGASVWSIDSERYYWENRPDYYENISIGFNYYALYWDRCVPFLLMLPKALQDD